MKKMLIALALLAGLTTAATAVPFDLVSQPSGATVIIDGRGRGVTPLQVLDLATDTPHHIRYELANHEPHDEFVTLKAGQPARLFQALKPLKGLLLVTSEPAEAEVLQNGYSLGQTPRLINTLDVGREHTLVLRKIGYQDSMVSVRFDGRRPLVQNVKLVLDSGVLNVRTEPEDAEVAVNGNVCGRSPAVLKGVMKGNVTVEIRKDGYRPETREITVVAGQEQNLVVKLEAIPGSMRLSSVPAGARFYLNDKPQPGDRTCEVANLAPGTYRVRAELKGYAPLERAVTVTHGQVAVEEFRLESVMGTAEFKTAPAGATVYLNGRRRGVTPSSDATSDTSDVLIVRDLTAGEYDVRIECHGYATWNGHLTVKPTESVQKLVRLKKVFTPDLRLTLVSGEVIEGVRVSEDASYLTLQVSLGMTRPIPREQIRKREPIFAQ